MTRGLSGRRAPLDDARLFELRWQRGLAPMTEALDRIYPGADLAPRLRRILERRAARRPDDLRALDLARDVDPDWFLHQRMAGYVFYVDRFAGTLADVPARIPYLRGMGVTYAHLMPLLRSRPGENDGGYAVTDYRAVDPALGTMADLRRTCRALREAGISPCIDMVLNHTAKEHCWARLAWEGSERHRAFFHMFDEPDTPAAHERTLLEVFPHQAPGNFTHYPEIGRWVWTTFNEFQWDLNWANPEVFEAILDTILWLANRGVEVFRLDAVAFMWKRMGTVCQNLPEVHDVIQALREAVRIAAPAVIFKAEAIVGPRDLVAYLGVGGREGKVSELAYHNSLMVQFWSSIAAGDARLAAHALAAHFPDMVPDATWATYLRCHDDIGWAITEEDAAAVPHTDGPGHRRFLADFYAGRFPGSFARGADFQVNEATGDRRTNGSLASLAGLEAALEAGSARDVELSVRRIVMGHALIASWGGIPLIYMGDEIGLTNDASFLDDPGRAEDGRWMQRPAMDWSEPRGPALRIREGVRHILARRAVTPQLAGTVPTRIVHQDDRCVLAFERPGTTRLVVVLNVTAEPHEVALASLGLDGSPRCALAGRPAEVERGRLRLGPYDAVWLVPS